MSTSSSRKFWTLVGYPIAVEADTAEEAFLTLSDGLVEAAEQIRAGADPVDLFRERVIELDEKGKKIKINTADTTALTIVPTSKKWTQN